ncbi:hypothetical protein NVP1170O_116 [Vibrio phage 1.170.O._10N.261.52.C3]|nr:hypothetical protein NVP1170O_116 [Vibrio phage 1.170.O._10N.261.52.C3]
MDKSNIVKSFISLMFYVKPSDVKVTKVGGIYTSEHRSVTGEDEKIWYCQFKFKHMSSGVKWRWKGGRWRTLKSDPVLSYQTKEDGSITVTEKASALEQSKTFKVGDFQE